MVGFLDRLRWGQISIGLAQALLPPALALGVQWVLWPWISPFIWFLFYPAVFCSAWWGGLWPGLISGGVSAALATYVFVEPQLSWQVANTNTLWSVALFLLMVGLISESLNRLRQSQRALTRALIEARDANETVSSLYRKTLMLDDLKNQVFANVSHELRTPLTLILCPLAERLASATLTEADRRQTEMMLRNARLLYRHVTDLLDVAKLESRQMGVTYARFDFGRQVRVVAAQFDSFAQTRRIRFDVEAPDGLIVEADDEKTQRIVLNLLSNAFKFTPDGGWIGLRLSEAGAAVTLAVADSGPGIPPDMRDLVFERFRQVPNGGSRHYGGTGLGLAIVREFVDLHGGSVAIADAPGGGALVSVSLPRSAPLGAMILDTPHDLDPLLDALAAEERFPPVRGMAEGAVVEPSDGPLVLVVDDNVDMNAFVAALLRPHFRVACAFDGAEGRDMALSLRPDLILSDVMMPTLGGELMVQELRRHPDLADTPIVVLTAKADEALRIRLLDSGVQDYICKPFVADELLARIGGLIRDRRRATGRLLESEIRFDVTFEQAAMGLALVAPDGHWLRVNRRLCQIVGYSESQLLGMTFQDITHPDDLERDLAQVRRLIDGEIPNYSTEKRYRRPDGSLVWVNLTVALVRRPDSSPDYFISVVEDIGQRKAAEAELRRKTEELAQRNDELERFNQASVGRELAMIALKQQINTLSGRLGLPPPYPLDFLGDGEVRP